MDRNQLFYASAGAITALALEKLINLLLFRSRNTHHSTDIVRTQPPHPEWTPPQPQPPPYDTALGWHSVDPSNTPPDVLYPLVISSVVPRPIAFISTLGEDGTTQNLAPYSYFNVVGHAPGLVAIGFCSTKLRDHGKKDSLYNILATKEFVVNIISEWFVEAANHCCGNFPYGTNEMALSGLTPLKSIKISPPRVAEAAVQLECIVRHVYDAPGPGGIGGSTVVIGEVVMWHVAEGVAGKSPSGKLVVDIQKLKPISRLGGNTYARTNDIFDLPRPDR